MGNTFGLPRPGHCNEVAAKRGFTVPLKNLKAYNTKARVYNVLGRVSSCAIACEK